MQSLRIAFLFKKSEPYVKGSFFCSFSKGIVLLTGISLIEEIGVAKIHFI